MAKKDTYNLQRLLEMRERGRDEAARFLGECRRQLAFEEDELENRKQAVENCRQEQQDSQTQMIEDSRSGIKQTEIARFRQHLSDLREKEIQLLEEVEKQKHTVARAEQEVDKALVKLNEAAKETKVIEKHRENWQADKKVEFNRREQKTNDEIGAILHERQKTD